MRRKAPTYRSLNMPKLVCGMPRMVFLIVGILSCIAFETIHGFIPVVSVIGFLVLCGRLIGKWNLTSVSTIVDGLFAPPIHAAAQYKKGGR